MTEKAVKAETLVKAAKAETAVKKVETILEWEEDLYIAVQAFGEAFG